MDRCEPNERLSELPFMLASDTRVRGECLGHRVELKLSEDIANHLLDALSVTQCEGMLLRGIRDKTDGDVLCELCAAHWMDLAGLVGYTAVGHTSTVWGKLAMSLFKDVCKEAGWDVKEMSNLIKSRKVDR